MKFTCLVEINLPKKRLVELWKDPVHLPKWQVGFERYEHISGKPHETGSKGRLHYNNKGTPMVLDEVVIEGNLPDVFEGEYIHQHMTNRMRSTFYEKDSSTTIWKAEIEYIQFNGVLMKLFAIIGKRMFKKQTQKWLDNFKHFAEGKG